MTEKETSSTYSRLKEIASSIDDEIIEFVVTTWCIEFLRMRKFRQFNIVEILALSFLALGVKLVIKEATRRKYGANNRQVVVSTRTTPMGTLDDYRRSPPKTRRKRYQYIGRSKSKYIRRNKNPYV